MVQASPLAGKPAEPALLVNIPRLITAYFSERPDAGVPEHRVSFGTSGHRGSSLHGSFNEWHILAMAQAICLYRSHRGIDGPLFLGIDTHALSVPAFSSALEILAANEVDVMIAANGEYTPTPAVSHAILNYNRGRVTGLADGIVITPSHNPPEDGGFKYNPPNGGPAETGITGWIQTKANELLESRLNGVKRIPFQKAIGASTTHPHDYIGSYVNDLANVIDMDAIQGAKVCLGEEEFVEIWRNRDSYLDDVGGIKDFQLLRGEAEEDATVFVSHSLWDSREAFRAWTESEAFAKAHRQARMPEGVLLGHPQFEGYEIVDLSKS